MVLGVLFGLLLVLGSILGLVAFCQLQTLRREVEGLRERLSRLSSQGEPAAAAPAPPQAQVPPSAPATEAPQRQRAAPAAPERPRPAPKKPPSRLWLRLRENWMVWLGGGCVALAGIFLARYGIEQGLLGPGARVTLGLLAALALSAGAEWLRRKTGAPHPAFAAMAGGGAITAFAALLSALHLYQMIAPGATFALLALVGLVTMWMARQHGPVLAAIGMLGAYSVPLLVSTGDGNVLVALVYSLIISASVLMLLRAVTAAWLWWGLLAGGLGWWAIALAGDQAHGWRGAYLALFAYGLMAIPTGDWLLRGDGPGRGPHLFPVLSLLLLIAAQCLSLWREGYGDNALWAWSPLAVLLLLAARRRPPIAFAPWLLLLGQGLALFVQRLHPVDGQWLLRPLPAAEQGGLLLFAGATALLFSAFALWNLRRTQARSAAYWWASLAVMPPLLALLLGYSLAGDFLSTGRWSLLAAVFGAVALALGGRGASGQWPRPVVVWLFVAGHAGYSLAACLLLERAGLTLALALQVVSLAWVVRRFEVPALGWLLKGAVALVLLRLTLNPWLAGYPADNHWTLWTYGGATLCAAAAARLLSRYRDLARWAEGAALHLLVLTLWAESRYWLCGGDAFAGHYGLAEAVINLWLFAALGIVYYRRSLVSEGLAPLYRGYGALLMLVALGNYLAIVTRTLASEPWVWQSISGRPLFNLLLPAFAGPALLGWLASRYYEPALRRAAGVFAALAGFVWISLEIRHLWQGSVSLGGGVATGELYTYSAVWLLLAAGALLLGSWRGWQNCYRGGMALLALVIVKLFMVDMADLEGLLRVASFMGLGLALLAIAYLHQRLRSPLR
ncbi:DUF2339 domain-containing protein [Microbulbifer litoralis]|uniref:DUF2339 domain-containing protein n=1 Tax=Microbulbifer litoralis TaxID=2933965 RepID=UPI00202919C9|nr:DUF2339 domain-containing protein [Microbulbifer sp. GX H0434]